MSQAIKMTEMNFDGATPVDSYGPGFFRIAGKIVEGPILLLPDRVLGWGGYPDLAAIRGGIAQIDILLVGTGADMAYLPPEFSRAVETLDIGLEAMATPAACRTYNVLLAEDRRVALAMQPV